MNPLVMKDYITSIIPYAKVFGTKTGYGIVHRDFLVYIQRLPTRTGPCAELRISKFSIDHVDSQLIRILVTQLATFCQRYGYSLTLNPCSEQLKTFWQERGFVPDENGILTFAVKLK